MGNLGAQKAKRNDTPISAKKDRFCCKVLNKE
ncbi:hypothetical protein [Enterococcus faecium]|nr:hypothetical protein [Enterococcus faecium]